MRGKLTRLLCLILVCGFAMLGAARARAQADPVAQDDLCPNNICSGNDGTWTVLTSQNLPTLEFANSDGAETPEPGALALVGSGLLLFGLVLRRKVLREES